MIKYQMLIVQMVASLAAVYQVLPGLHQRSSSDGDSQKFRWQPLIFMINMHLRDIES